MTFGSILRTRPLEAASAHETVSCFSRRSPKTTSSAWLTDFALRRRSRLISSLILSDIEIDALRVYAWNSRHPRRNDVMVLLSVKAGLRAKEIAALTWCMVLGAGGEIGPTIELSDAATKGKRGRVIPVHPDLTVAMSAHVAGADIRGPVIVSERGGPMLPVNVVHWFARAFEAIGAAGCSSHSGRRTFITRAARTVHRTGGSLRDVQILAGHQSIDMTQRYIEGDTDAQRRLVALI